VADTTDYEEIEFACLLLDSARVSSPLVDIGWVDAWQEGLVTGADVMEAVAELADE